MEAKNNENNISIKYLLEAVNIKFPEFRVYRKKCLLVEKDEIDIMLQFQKHNLKYSCVLYFYVNKGKEFAFEPIFFRGDYNKILEIIDKLTPALKSDTSKDAINKCEMILDENKSDFMAISFNDH
jgi:hypothetical protein